MEERLEDVTLLSEDGEGATGQGMLKRSLGSLVGLRGNLWLRRPEEVVWHRAAVPVNYACVGAVF